MTKIEMMFSSQAAQDKFFHERAALRSRMALEERNAHDYAEYSWGKFLKEEGEEEHGNG